MKQIILGLIVAGVTSISFAHAQDADAGKRVFARCLSCHKVGPNAANAVGPDLNGVVGRKAGTEEGYAYSDPMKNSGITWDVAELHAFLTDPKAKVPGTKMAFPGIKDATQLDNLIAYLGTFNADGTTK